MNFIDGTIALMGEIVIVIADLFLPPSSDETAGSFLSGHAGFSSATSGSTAYSPAASSGAAPGVATGTTLPGLQHLTRFGTRRALTGEGGWRAELARRLGRDDLSGVPPAAIGATALPATSPASPSGSDVPPAGSTVWFATPVHLIASLTTLHLDRRSLLVLSESEARELVADFNCAFRGDDPSSALRLQSLPAGQLLLDAPASLAALTTDPARALVEGLEASLPKGSRATPLKRLGAELEMWLHAHPLNEARQRRGELPVSTLWLWGGGPAHPELHSHASQHTAQPNSTTTVWGTDPYLVGLARLSGVSVEPLPDSLPDLTGSHRLSGPRRLPGPRRLSGPRHVQLAVAVTEVTSLLHANPQWTVLEAIADLDRRFISPALAALHAGNVEAVTLIANDLQMRVQRRDRLKLWRPRQPGLTGLVVRSPRGS